MKLTSTIIYAVVIMNDGFSFAQDYFPLEVGNVFFNVTPQSRFESSDLVVAYSSIQDFSNELYGLYFKSL